MAWRICWNCYIIKGKMWVPLGEYPSSRSQNITPYCPIQPLYNPYIGGICGYISRVLSQGYPTFPFDITPVKPNIELEKASLEKARHRPKPLVLGFHVKLQGMLDINQYNVQHHGNIGSHFLLICKSGKCMVNIYFGLSPLSRY